MFKRLLLLDSFILPNYMISITKRTIYPKKIIFETI